MSYNKSYDLLYTQIYQSKNKTKLGFWIPQELSLTFFPLMCYKSTMDHGDLRSRDEGCCSLLGTHRSPLKFVPWITSGFKVRGSFWSIFWTDGWPAKLAWPIFLCVKNAWTSPIGSMYGIYANIGDILMVNVTIYSIHGSYGSWRPWVFGWQKIPINLAK